jgi:hypothetical protein
MILGTWNGASILALPANPGFKSVEFGMNDTVAANRSPFTGRTQVQVWPGADFWDASIALPQMDAAAAARWTAFLGECRGMTNVFYLFDPLRRHPLGSAAGAPLVSGVNPAMATVLHTKGWTPNAAGVLLAGDQCQVGVRLLRVLNTVNADGNGNASIDIWPSIREATADGDAITLTNPKGLFRLAENRRSVLGSETRLSGVSLKAVEAR